MYRGSFFQFWLNPRAFNKSPQGKARHAKWAKKVYRKHNGACDNCDYRVGGSMALEAHHLNTKDHFPRQAYAISNGVALCSDCHKEFHSWMGGTRKKCTNRDYKRWKNINRNRLSSVSYGSIYVSIFVVFFWLLATIK